MTPLTASPFPVPIAQRHFEDYVPGASYTFDEQIRVDQDDLVEFAAKFDPQSFHVDPRQQRTALSPG